MKDNFVGLENDSEVKSIVVLAEEPSSVSNTHMAVHNSL